jgi:hypothetical protein
LNAFDTLSHGENTGSSPVGSANHCSDLVETERPRVKYRSNINSLFFNGEVGEIVSGVRVSTLPSASRFSSASASKSLDAARRTAVS